MDTLALPNPGGAEGLGPDENGAVTGRYWLRGGGNECRMSIPSRAEETGRYRCEP